MTQVWHIFIYLMIGLYPIQAAGVSELILNASGEQQNHTPTSSKTTASSSTTTPTSTIPTPSETYDITFTPNTAGQTFRLALDTKYNPGMTIIPFDEGVYVIMDRKYKIHMPPLSAYNGVIAHIDTLDDPKVLILKFTLHPFIYVHLEKIDNRLYLTFFYRDAGSPYGQTPTPSLLTFEEKTWPTSAITQTGKGTFAFITIDNTPYYVYMTVNPDGGLQQFYKTPYYSIAQTSQGVAVRYFSPHIEFRGYPNHLIIHHPIKASFPPLLKSQFEKGRFNTLFDTHPDRNLYEENRTYDAISNTLTSTSPLMIAMQRAWLNLTQGFGQEAKIILENCAHTYPRITTEPLYKAYLGMAYFQSQHYEQALTHWQTVPDTLEIIIWKKLAESALGRFNGIDQIIFKISKLIEHYPPKLRKIFIKQSLRTFENLHYHGAILDMIDHHPHPHSRTLTNLYTLYKAKVSFEKKEYYEADRLLDDITIKGLKDQISSEFLAEYTHLKNKTKFNIQQLSITDTITACTNARLMWRGTGLEYQIMLESIRLLEREKRFGEAFPLLRDVKRLFPIRASIELVDLMIQRFYVQYFKTAQNISPLKIIKTYTDYIDFMPDGKDGEDIIHMVTDQFLRLDLLNEAAELLTRTIANKPATPEKIDIIFKIADLHMHNHKYDAVSATLDMIPSEIATLTHKTKATTMRAQALLNENKITEALSLLETSTQPDHVLMAVRIYCQQKRLDIAADKLLGLLYALDHKKEKDRVIHVLNELAIVYYKDNQTDKREALGKKYTEIMKGQANFIFLTRIDNQTITNRAEAEAMLNSTHDVTDFVTKTLDTTKPN